MWQVPDTAIIFFVVCLSIWPRSAQVSITPLTFFIGILLVYNAVFLLYNEVNQLYIYTYILPSHPSFSFYIIAEHWTEFPVLFSSFLLAISFTHGRVYMSVLISQFVQPPLPPVSTCPFPMSVYPFLLWKWVHLYHFYRFHICVLKYGICFSLSEVFRYELHLLKLLLTVSHFFFLANFKSFFLL